ncbi:unnamed protein product [Spirodela intermedia]|uniref:Uncharacterized protein n=1 Tax=Spirodela intermedia TaxID=51605 RepID=A0A7I8KN00_SPIIN|nr:unnamed protein product [Spirodela intermedia]
MKFFLLCGVRQGFVFLLVLTLSRFIFLF